MLNNLLLSSGDTGDKLYVEDVFATHLYSGNNSTQTITNGIDLAGKGGMVWIKSRSHSGASGHVIHDTVRGAGKLITPSGNGGSILGTKESYFTGSGTNDFYAFTSSGFSLGGDTYFYKNTTGQTYASWTFCKSPKFFDCVTWTGNGANRTISHALGVVPGLIIVKRTDTTGDWQVYHRSLANTEYMVLNTTDAKATGTTRWNSTTPTATEFSLGTDATVNASGGSYVAYLFAHDTTADGIVQCGSYTGNGSTTGPTIELGWEPQFVLIKSSSVGTGFWSLCDNMRGMPVNNASLILYPNSSMSEDAGGAKVTPLPNGFQINSTSSNENGSGQTYIYLAIRRGPMRVPTDATKVFSTDTFGSSLPTPPAFKAGFPVDLGFYRQPGAASDWIVTDRLRGTPELKFNLTNTEAANSVQTFDYQTGYYNSTGTYSTYRSWMLRRAPGFFDVVCYTGTGSATTINHNLGVVPEMIIVKGRNAATDWPTYHIRLNGGVTPEQWYVRVNSTTAQTNAVANWNNTAPTSTVFSVGGNNIGSGTTFVAYLFATCPGVSKVGSYTGTGATQTISCGFTGGARFVLIKRADGVASWWVWDTARGMVAGTDPRLALNNTNAEANANWVYTTTGGFQIVTSDTSINASGGTYIYLAIA